MTLEELKATAPGLGKMSEGIRICFFGWWLHRHGGKEYFHPADIGKCYDQLHLVRPSSFSGYFKNLVDCDDLLRSAKGYRLTHGQRDKYESTYGQSAATVQITQLLKDLPARLPDLAEKTYLDEALVCYHGKAFRAAVIMTWNLAYAHLCDHVVKHKLAEFNARWLQDNPKAHKNGMRTIVTVDDFNNEELKEFQVLKICSDAGIITKNVYNIMEPALKRRNAAGHPNDVSIGQLQADAHIHDLVINAVLKIA